MLLPATLLLAMSSQVHASGSVDCMTQDQEIILGIGMSRSIIFEPLNAYAQHGQDVWSTHPVDGQVQLGSHQGLIERDRLAVDYMDEDSILVVMSLRVYYEDETEQGYAGTVTFADGVVHPVVCTFG